MGPPLIYPCIIEKTWLLDIQFSCVTLAFDYNNIMFAVVILPVLGVHIGKEPRIQASSLVVPTIILHLQSKILSACCKIRGLDIMYYKSLACVGWMNFYST